MEPAGKNPILAEWLDRLFGRTKAIVNDQCTGPGCTTPDLKFRNAINQKEYTLSGLCQTCQDNFFEEGVTDEDY